MEWQLEKLKIINMLKGNLKIPFIFLCGGECGILRRIGGEIGCCMYLCVYEYDKLATSAQLLLKEVKRYTRYYAVEIRELIGCELNFTKRLMQNKQKKNVFDWRNMK